MNILGVNYYFHDTSVCLVVDGQLVAAIEEERLNLEKHTTRFPRMAIDRCLAIGGLSHGDIEHIAFSIKPTHNWKRKLAYGAKHGASGRSFLKREVSRLNSNQRGVAKWLLEGWPRFARRPKMHFVEHHLSHVAGSFLVSPYKEAALLGIDGAGEWATSFLGVGKGSTVTCFKESFFPHSIGSFYEAPTEFCGFRPNYDEGKTMGLAPCGDASRFYNVVADMIQVEGDGGIHVDLSYFEYQYYGHRRCGQKFYNTFGPPRESTKDGKVPFAQHHLDVAAAFQKVLEERVLDIARILHRKTQAKYLVLSGGVALNSVMNGRIVRESPFEDIYVMPGAGDNGTCIGAAYYVANTVLGAPRSFVHDDPYIGPEYSDAEIQRAIRAAGFEVLRCDPVAKGAELLLDGKIVAWYQGRMEFGPRALGNRCILANPTLPSMKDHVNARVKHREAFRPFAPSVIQEQARELFDTEVDAPFMLKVCDVRPEYRDKLPAITHVDGTARLQTVHKETNPKYHALISELGKESGLSVVLNTSFNVMGQPIVESPKQAIDCYLGTGIDALILGDYFLAK